jgi:hypothetical protein
VSELEFRAIRRDGEVVEVTDSEEALEILRHSTSHLMALAVTQLYPEVHLGIGPPTSEGFYYDFQTPHRLTEEDLETIEKKMQELRSQDLPFEPSIVSREKALELFQKEGFSLVTSWESWWIFALGPMFFPLPNWARSSCCLSQDLIGEGTSSVNSCNAFTAPHFFKKESFRITWASWRRLSSAIIVDWESN